MNTIQPNTNTGVIITPPQPEDLHVGALSPSLANTTSDWRQYECDGEWQKEMQVDFETEACMSFTGSNNIATYLNWLISTGQILPAQLTFLKANGYIGTDGKVALSPRFTAKMSGTTTNGNDFQNVWNSLGNDGVVPDSLWPMPAAELNVAPSGEWWNIYYAEPPSNVLALGKQFLTYFSVQWEWLVSNGNGATQAQYIEWLTVAPIHIAIEVCTPWNTALPIAGCGSGAQHGVQLSHVTDGVVNNILDHYVPFDKQLEANYTLAYAVRGNVEQIPQVVAPVQAPTTPTTTLTPAQRISILQQLVVLYEALLKSVGITPRILPTGSILPSMNTISPALLGFLRGVGMVVITGVLIYIGDATHLSFLNPAVASLIAVLALTLEHAISPTGTALFGAVRT